MAEPIVVEIQANDVKFKQSLQQAERFARDTGKEIDQSLQTKLELNVADAKIQLESASRELREFDGSAERRRELIINTERARRNLTEARRELRNLQNTGSQTTSRLGRLFGSLWQQIRWAFLSFAGIWAVIWGIASLGRWIRNTIQTAIDFESAFAGVAKTVDATDSELAVLRAQLEDLNQELPVSFQELSRIAELAGQLGVATDDIASFTNTIAQIAATTNLTAEEAATSFARIANVVWLPLWEIDTLASVVVELGNNFATTEAEILTFTQRLASAWAVAWFAPQELAAIATALSSVGVQAEAGGTAISKAFIEINTAVATGSKELQWFADTAWLTAQEFSTLFREDAGAAFNAFVSWLAEQWDNAVSTIDELLWANVRTRNAFLALASAWDILSSSLASANSEFEIWTALQIEAAKRFGTTASQLQILNGRIQNLQSDLWESGKEVSLLIKQLQVWFLQAILRLSDAFWQLSSTLQWVLWSAGIWALLLGITAIIPWVNILTAWIVWLTAALGAGWFIAAARSWIDTTSELSREYQELQRQVKDATFDLGSIKQEIQQNVDAQEQLRREFDQGWLSIAEYNRRLAELEDEYTSLQEATEGSLLSTSDLISELNRLESQGIDLSQETNELRTLRQEAIDTRFALDALFQARLKQFETTRKLLEEQTEQVERWQRALESAGAVAGFTDAQFQVDLANLNQATFEIQTQNAQLERLGVNVEEVETALGKFKAGNEESTEAIQESIEASKKQRDTLWDLEDQAEDTEWQFNDLFKEAAKDAEWFEKELEWVEDRIKSLQDDIADLRDDLASVDEWLATDLGDRFAELQEEIDWINAEIQAWLASWDFDGWELARLQQEITDLQEEQNLARANLDQEEIEAALARQEESTTERLLRQAEEDRLRIEQQIAAKEAEIAEEEEKRDRLLKITEIYYEQLKDIDEDYTSSFEDQGARQLDVLNRLIAKQRELNALRTAFASESGNQWGNTTNNVNNVFNQNVANQQDAQVILDWIINNTQNVN